MTYILQLLLENDATLEGKDKDDRVPLLWATENGYEAAVRLVLENGAAIEAR